MTGLLPLTLAGMACHQTAWCANPGCNAPIPAQATECPDCHAAQPALLQATEPRDALPLDTLRDCDLGVLRVYRGDHLEQQRVFRMARVRAALRQAASERYRAACAQGGPE